MLRYPGMIAGNLLEKLFNTFVSSMRPLAMDITPKGAIRRKACRFPEKTKHLNKTSKKEKMLSSKVIEYCKARGWWFEDLSRSYSDVMRDSRHPFRISVCPVLQSC